MFMSRKQSSLEWEAVRNSVLVEPVKLSFRRPACPPGDECSVGKQHARGIARTSHCRRVSCLIHANCDVLVSECGYTVVRSSRAAWLKYPCAEAGLSGGRRLFAFAGKLTTRTCRHRRRLLWKGAGCFDSMRRVYENLSSSDSAGVLTCQMVLVCFSKSTVKLCCRNPA